MSLPLIFELSKEGRSAVSLPPLDVPAARVLDLIPEGLYNEGGPDLPEIPEIDLVRHFTLLSQKNFSVDTAFYPLGSCTMKYNPKVNEDMASLEGFSRIHPDQPASSVQGILELLHDLERYLCAIFGFDAFTLQPAAGAHGELTALLMIKAYHRSRGDEKRVKVIVPDSSHGTNPASVSLVGYEAVQVRSDDSGGVDLGELKAAVGDDVAALMLTNPNTLGLFDANILKIASIVHEAGGIMYWDGANANATLHKIRPADMGFDIAHINLHKTFSTPHGGGGPGSGPVGCKSHLVPFLPVPYPEKSGAAYSLSTKRSPSTIGRVHSFNGNVSVMVKAYAYIRSLGASGLKRVTEDAVLAANYMMKRLKGHYFIPYDAACQHEFVISAKWQKEKYGIRALDIAKRIIDFGFHPPTIYFPLIVPEALMIEPTETETIETLDAFCDAMIRIAKEAEEDPGIIRSAPHSTPVSRLDETRAARIPDLRWRGGKK